MALGKTFSTFDDQMPQRLSFEDSCDDFELVCLLKAVGNKGPRRWEKALYGQLRTMRSDFDLHCRNARASQSATHDTDIDAQTFVPLPKVMQRSLCLNAASQGLQSRIGKPLGTTLRVRVSHTENASQPESPTLWCCTPFQPTQATREKKRQERKTTF